MPASKEVAAMAKTNRLCVDCGAGLIRGKRCKPCSSVRIDAAKDALKARRYAEQKQKRQEAKQ